MILTFRKLRQKFKFKASQEYIVRPCVKRSKGNKISIFLILDSPDKKKKYCFLKPKII